MTVSDLDKLFDYGYWANRRLFHAIDHLSPEQFVQPVAGSYGSIRNTLVHALSAEWGWLERCGGRARGAKLEPDNYPTRESVVSEWARVECYVREFLATLTDHELSRSVEFAMPGGPARIMPLGDLLQHAALHAVHHRGQAALLLRELGVAPGNFDLLLYDIERSSARV